ncbi:hypothetical protein [Paenibacillus whitsoniae]|uniref:DUF4209 domain-containing protein n=1 Tax=Paenibacillus whitsoniae TaxID=2496558 RepID=A0A430J9H4_9BACL|nr:hypothetical protein [Paenibacillus whitsoniae]RTE07177.1 hypothetical protein EJQ19_21740 [Paenibacillus whitsoniae]
MNLIDPLFQEKLKKQFEEITKTLSSLPKIDWNAQFSLLEEIAIEGADKGWTIPPHSTIRECQEMIEGKSKVGVDYEFKLHYEELDNYNRMKSELLSVSSFGGKWKKLLEDCFINYEQGRHAIVIPSLFLILEGVIFDIVKNQKWKIAFRRINKQITDGSIQKPLFTSVRRFIDKAFGYGYFEVESFKPSFINRNWVLHGRDNIGEWESVDALRLFNALYSLTFFDDFYGKDTMENELKVMK